VPLCRVGTLAPVHPTVRRLVGQGQAAAGCEHVGDQLLGLGERLGSGRGDRGGSRLNPGRQLRGGGNAPVPPVGRLRGQLAFEALPVLPHALSLAARGVVPGGTQRNLEAARDVEWADDLAPHEQLLCVDAQTSGGLLLAVPPENESALLEALHEAQTPAAATVGRLVAGPAGHIRVTRRL